MPPPHARVTAMPELKRMLDRSEAGEKLSGEEMSFRQGSAEMDYFMARNGLRDGEQLRHGLSHLASLLGFDAAHPEWNSLLERYAQQHGGDLEELIPAGEQRYFAYEALRAWCQQRRGELEPAVRLLNAVTNAKPDSNYLEAWGLPWVEAGFERLSHEAVLFFAMGALNRYPESREATRLQLERMGRFARIAARLAEKSAPSPQLDMALAGLHRKAGLFEQGLAFARAALKRQPSWHAHVALGLMLRSGGKAAEAEAAFLAAAAADPSDVSAFLELGDTWFNLDEWKKAAKGYEGALKRERDNAWAKASLEWCHSPPADDSELPEKLVALARKGNGRARALCSRFSWYWGVLPYPSEAITNAIGGALEKGDKIDALAATDVESPSNLLVYPLLGHAPLKVTWGNVAKPDPREPVEPIAFTLWRREGELLVPALRAPPRSVQQQIAELATGRYEPGLQWGRSSRLAHELGPGAVEPLLACVVHPPPVPAGAEPIMWIVRCQHAVASTLAHLDGGWEDSVRRKALFSLLLGPRDWSTEAAIVALARLADDVPWIALDVHAAFSKLDAARADRGGCAHEYALLRFWSGLPCLFDAERDALRARLDALTASR